MTRYLKHIENYWKQYLQNVKVLKKWQILKVVERTISKKSQKIGGRNIEKHLKLLKNWFKTIFKT